MEKLKEIYNYILYYLKLGWDYAYTYLLKIYEIVQPYLIELYNYLYPLVLEHRILFSVIGLLILYLYIKSRRPKVLRKRKYKKARLTSKKSYYNTGFKCELCLWDIIKFKIRLGDYCDKKGIRYSYLFNIKLFGVEFLRMKYIDQKGQVFKRKITFRS